MITDTALEVYRHVVATPDDDAAAAAFALGLTAEQFAAARNELVAAGLAVVARGTDGRLVPVAPELALTRAVHDDEHSVREISARIAANRTAYLGLVPAYEQARRSRSDATEVTLLEDLPTIRDFLADTCRTTRQELLIAHPTRHLSAESLDEGLPQDIEMLARGVARKTLYLNSNRDSPAVRRAVARTCAAGAEVRVLPVIPARVMCFDSRIAIVSRVGHEGDVAAIVVRDDDLVRVIRHVYLAAWQQAENFLDVADDAGAVDVPSQLDRAILTGLARGQSDEQIARRQDVSVRTCRRHIHDLTARLGATTRFQAAVLATQRGWI